MGKKVTIVLEPSKTVELSDFSVSGSNTVQMRATLVELGVSFVYCFDFSGYPAWKQANPPKTWRDYAKEKLLGIYDSYALAGQARAMMDADAQ